MPRLMAALPFFSEPSKRLYLPYRLARLPMTQARFSRRLLLQPELDLSRYKVRGEIDWIKIALSLGRDTQPIHVQSRLAPTLDGKVFVEGEGEKPYTGRNFTLLIQNPIRSRIDEGLKVLEGEWGIPSEPEVVEIEISVDWRPDSRISEERQRMVGLLHRHFLPLELLDRGRRSQERWIQPRVTVGDNLPKPLTFPVFDGNDVWEPYIDGTFYAGAKGDDVLWRIMDKVTDRRRKGGMAVPLPPKDRRARIEVRLRKRPIRELGIRTLRDLETFQFERLRERYFPFWLATIPMNFGSDVGDPARRIARRARRRQYVKHALSAGAYLALRNDYRRALSLSGINKAFPVGERLREGGRLKRYALGRSGYLLTFDDLNKRTRNALRRLRY